MQNSFYFFRQHGYAFIPTLRSAAGVIDNGMRRRTFAGHLV